jgi:hypothetical protein
MLSRDVRQYSFNSLNVICPEDVGVNRISTVALWPSSLINGKLLDVFA